MVGLKIPKLKKKSNQYLFKDKLTLSRKSSRRLFKESFFLFSITIIILVINFYIPQKILLFNSFFENINNTYQSLLQLFGYLFNLLLVIFIVLSLLLALITLLGSGYRIFRIYKKKNKRITYR